MKSTRNSESIEFHGLNRKGDSSLKTSGSTFRYFQITYNQRTYHTYRTYIYMI